MKFTSKIKKLTSAALAAGLVSAFALAATASAIPYSGTTTPGLNYPAFNVYTGTPSVGDESDFLRGKEEASTGYINDVNSACTNGTRYTVRVYVHNAADQNKNDGGNGPSVAKNSQVKVNLPASTTASSFSLSSVVSASNATAVSDSMTINCGGKTVALSYVSGSAKQFTVPGGTQALNDSIVAGGAPIGTQSPNGDVWGCWDQRVWVTLTLEVKDVVVPTTPTTPTATPPTTPTTTTTPKQPTKPAAVAAVKPQQLPNAGAGDVAALFALATIGGTLGYRWFLSRQLSQ